MAYGRLCNYLKTAELIRYPTNVTRLRLAMKHFSIRALLILTTGVAILMALPLSRAVAQKRGRDWVATQKGRVSFSHNYNPATDTWDHKAKLHAPDWLIGALGIDFFDSVDTVVLDNTEAKDLSPIIDLRSLR